MGGKAIKESSPVTKEVLESIFVKVKNYFGSGNFEINSKYIKMIGSGGKKKTEELYGDLDVAIYIGEFYDSKDYFFDDIKKLLKHHPYKDMRQIGVFSFGFTHSYVGNEVIQIDIMPTFNFNWVVWAHHSPHYKESEYKGLYRNEVLYAVAKYIDKNITKHKDEIPIEWNRYFFDLSQGFLRGQQTRKGKTKILKNPKTTHKWVITTNPNEATELLFGKGIKANNILTFEDALKHLTSPTFPHKEKMIPILNMIKKGIKSKKVPVPQIFLDIMENENAKNLDKAS